MSFPKLFAPLSVFVWRYISVSSPPPSILKWFKFLQRKRITYSILNFFTYIIQSLQLILTDFEIEPHSK